VHWQVEKQIVSVMCCRDIQFRNAIPKVAFQMTLSDCQNTPKVYCTMFKEMFFM